MKTIIVLISIMVLGLYSCEKESTSAIQEEKKYTLEEILADTNWVEITDTLHYPDTNLRRYSYLFDGWQPFTIKKFETLEEFKLIETLSDTTSHWYVKGAIKYDIDFEKNTLIGLRTQTSVVKYKKQIYKNNILKRYQYFVSLITPIPELRINVGAFNFILIPKFNNTYSIAADTIQIWEN